MRIRWKGFELPVKVSWEEENLTDKYGLCTAEPFERGYGTTIGNSLRRILLSSLEGAAVTSIKIADVSHEFTTVKGVLEDVAEIVLNVKQLRLRMHTDEERTIRVERHEPGEIHAGDIETDAQVEVANPELLLASLTEEGEFSMAMNCRRGRGYTTAEENAEGEHEIGVIPVASIFSPVSRVRYRSENTRVGQMTDYDRLVMEVWTDGTVTPQMAVVEAAKILRRHTDPFLFEPELLAEGSGMIESGESDERDVLDTPLEEMNLSVRAENALRSRKVATLRDITDMTEKDLLGTRNLGKTSLDEIRGRLDEYEVELKAEDE